MAIEFTSIRQSCGIKGNAIVAKKSPDEIAPMLMLFIQPGARNAPRLE